MFAYLAHLSAARLWLADIHPWLPAVLLILAVWAPQWLVRKYRPKWWEYVATFGWRVVPAQFAPLIAPHVKAALKVWQALPSLLAGAMIGAVTTGGDPWGAVWGALIAALAPLKHEALKALPWLSYRGGSAPAASPAPKGGQ